LKVKRKAGSHWYAIYDLRSGSIVLPAALS